MTFYPRLTEFLTEDYAQGSLVPHRQDFGAQPVAGERPEPEVAKVVAVRDGAGEFLMVALPTERGLDLGALARATGREGLRLATEPDLGPLFADCELGARPAFGHLYGLPVYVDACFPVEPEIFALGSSRHERIGMRLSDYEGVAPVAGQSCFHEVSKAA